MLRNVVRISCLLLLVLIIFGLGTGTGLLAGRIFFLAPSQADIASSSESGPNLALVTEAWNTIQKEYVDRSALQDGPMTYGAISGMVDALGDTGHSTFLSPSMVKQEQQQTAGEYDGIGAQVQQKDGNAVIVAPLDGSPALKAGLLPGDIIMRVDGQDVTGHSLDQILQQIVGPAGTSVTLTIMTPSTGVTRDVTIVRAKITIHNVTWVQLPGTTIAQVRLAEFSQGATQDLKTALAQIQQQHLTGIILDMRNNPGGLLSESVGTASQFLASGNVLQEKNAQGQTRAVAVQPGGVATDIPMVVLIDYGTASAAEIVAGALQDAHRATLVGDTTFGTGTVLNEFPLSDGSALMLATQEWLTPSGRVIWHKGITPDQAVPLGATVLPVLPETARSMTASDLQASGDQQLLQAMNILSQSTNASP